MSASASSKSLLLAKCPPQFSYKFVLIKKRVDVLQALLTVVDILLVNMIICYMPESINVSFKT